MTEEKLLSLLRSINNFLLSLKTLKHIKKSSFKYLYQNIKLKKVSDKSSVKKYKIDFVAFL